MSEDVWTDFFSSLTELLKEDGCKDPQCLDELIHAALERVTNSLGRFSHDFIRDSSVLMRLVAILTTCVFTHSTFLCCRSNVVYVNPYYRPRAEELLPLSSKSSSLLVKPENRLRIRKFTL